MVCFHNFFSLFVRFFYGGEGFSILQNVLALMDTLLLYHCPKLATLLTLAGLEPVCYATPWLLTLFASKLDIPSVCQLWDKLIDRNDRTFAAYISIAILSRAEAQLLDTEISALPEALSALTPLPLEETWEMALHYQMRSPPRFARFLWFITAQLGGQEQWIKHAPRGVVELNPQEILLEKEWHGGLVIIDTRAKEEFDGPSGRVPKAVRIDNTMDAIEMVRGTTACHFCILDPVMAAECAIDAHCAQVCTVSNGYAALHDLALREEVELIDHDEKRCNICRPAWAHKTDKAHQWLSKVTHQSYNAVKSAASTAVATLSAPEPEVRPHHIHLPVDKQLGAWGASTQKDQLGTSSHLPVDKQFTAFASTQKDQSIPCIVVLSEDFLYLTEESPETEALAVIAGPFHLRSVVRIAKRVRKHDGNRVFYFRDKDRKEYLGFVLDFDLVEVAEDFTKKCQNAVLDLRQRSSIRRSK